MFSIPGGSLCKSNYDRWHRCPENPIGLARLIAICAALRDFVPADNEADRARWFSLHLGGSTTGLSGIGACAAVADDDGNMRPIGHFSQ
jgi:hypothetical protein